MATALALSPCGKPITLQPQFVKCFICPGDMAATMTRNWRRQRASFQVPQQVYPALPQKSEPDLDRVSTTSR